MLNGKAQHANGVNGNAHVPLHTASDVIDPIATDPLQSRPLTTDAAQLSRHLAVSQHELRVAQDQIQMLLSQDSVLKQRVVALVAAATQARDFAYHDPLTGLPNRTLLLDRFHQAVALAQRQHTQVALLFLDLDRFKNINDTFGHATGDKLLQEVALRLSRCIRASDTAARYGGDEFVVLLPEFKGSASAVGVAESIRARVALPYLIDGISMQMSVSLGVAVYPVDGKEYGDLIHQSDSAMYRDKHHDAPPAIALASL